MEYNYLGNTGLRVSNLCLGTMTFGKNPEDCSEEVAHQILDEFVAKGGNFIDTADIYNFGLSEEILGRWLMKQPKRNRIILSTKLMSVSYFHRHLNRLLIGPAFVDTSSYVASLHKTSFGTECGASVLIYPRYKAIVCKAAGLPTMADERNALGQLVLLPV